MKKPRIGVFKFTSCDGCQLTILNMEEEFLELLAFFDIGYFREAADKPLRGQFDIALVEGSITTDLQRKEIIDIRERSRYLITIGACATSGGLQALRNWASIIDFKKNVYPSPAFIETFSTSAPISEYVYPNYELWGCPIDKPSLIEVLTSYLINKKPGLPRYSLCIECKGRGIPCLLISKAEPCLGPITMAGCGVICPSLDRPCYGCFGPREDANIESLGRQFEKIGINKKEFAQLLDKMNTYAFRKAKTEQGRAAQK